MTGCTVGAGRHYRFFATFLAAFFTIGFATGFAPRLPAIPCGLSSLGMFALLLGDHDRS